MTRCNHDLSLPSLRTAHCNRQEHSSGRRKFEDLQCPRRERDPDHIRENTTGSSQQEYGTSRKHQPMMISDCSGWDWLGQYCPYIEDGPLIVRTRNFNTIP